MEKTTKPRALGWLDWIPTAVVLAGIVVLVIWIFLGWWQARTDKPDSAVFLQITANIDPYATFEVSIGRDSEHIDTRIYNNPLPFIISGIMLCVVGLFLYKEKRNSRINIDEYNYHLERIKNPCNLKCLSVLRSLHDIDGRMLVVQMPFNEQPTEQEVGEEPSND